MFSISNNSSSNNLNWTIEQKKYQQIIRQKFLKAREKKNYHKKSSKTERLRKKCLNSAYFLHLQST